MKYYLNKLLAIFLYNDYTLKGDKAMSKKLKYFLVGFRDAFSPKVEIDYIKDYGEIAKKTSKRLNIARDRQENIRTSNSQRS